jgi:hypothetical protein
VPDDFIIRPFQPGDDGAILDLFNRCFPHAPRSIEQFRWKYQRNPFGNERISLAFDQRGRLVGHYAGYPVPVHADGRSLVAHQIGDTMTDPSIRHVGRGPTSILGRTALHFYEHFCQGKVAFNYGFNASNIQKFSMRFLRAERVEPVSYRVWPRVPPLPRWRRWIPGLQIEVVRQATPEFDELFQRAAPRYQFLVRRDALYLRWRYLECPGAPYLFLAIRKWRRLIGWSVFVLRDSRFAWVDALFDPHHLDAIGIVLRQVAGGGEVHCWLPGRPAWFGAALRDLGFESRPEPQDLAVMVVPFVMGDAGRRVGEEMHYAMGDSDLF